MDAPFVAVMVMMSPAEPPLEETLGVVSFVRLSVADEPESETADRSGVPGADGAVESTVSGSAVPAVDWLPAGSVTFAVTDQLPAESAGRSHDVAEPTTYEHVFVVEPLDAVNSTVSPAEAPGSDMAGVVSDVMLSVSDPPVSDDAARSGADGAAGAVVSMPSEVDGPADDSFPAGSVNLPDTDHVPSVRVGRSHDVAEPTTYEHVFVVEPLVAVIVAVSPVDPPATENAGVVSEVTSSAEEVPESDAGARSGAAGAAGGVVSSVTVGPAAAAPGPTVPVDDVTDPDESVGVTVPSLHPDTVTVNVADVPTDGLGVKTQPVAFPAFEKSAALSVEASIVPEKSRE